MSRDADGRSSIEWGREGYGIYKLLEPNNMRFL
jgi:hypothetical protein